MSDNRAAPRSRTLLPARIEIAELGTIVNCTIRDLSETGARLQVPSSVTLPSTFTIHIPKFDRLVRATQKWRHGDGIGIAFENEVVSADPRHVDRSSDPKYVKKLEEENARLKLLLEQIRADPMKARLLLDDAA